MLFGMYPYITKENPTIKSRRGNLKQKESWKITDAFWEKPSPLVPWKALPQEFGASSTRIGKKTAANALCSQTVQECRCPW
jgi:hypothetical protein